MALTHLLDTSVYCQPLKIKQIPTVKKHWRQHGENRLAVSAVCQAELLQGLYHRNSKKLWQAYESELKGQLPVLPVDSLVADVYAQRVAQSWEKGKTRPTLDLFIAATAIANDLILATLNPKDFGHIDGLKIEDWGK